MSMSGHECTLSETNRGGWLYVCECGGISLVHPVECAPPRGTLRWKRAAERARYAAIQEHAEHLDRVRNEIGHAHARALDARAAYLKAVKPTVTRLGRWGNG